MGLACVDVDVVGGIAELAWVWLQGAVKIMAKDLVRTRQYTTKFIEMKTHLNAVSLKLQVCFALYGGGLAETRHDGRGSAFCAELTRFGLHVCVADDQVARRTCDCDEGGGEGDAPIE